MLLLGAIGQTTPTSLAHLSSSLLQGGASRSRFPLFKYDGGQLMRVRILLHDGMG